MFKRNGTYYFMWSENDTRSEDYQVAYATSNSPLGPWTKRGVVLQKDLDVGHQGHRAPLGRPGAGHRRLVHRLPPLRHARRQRHQPRDHHRPDAVQRRRHHPARRTDALRPVTPARKRDTPCRESSPGSARLRSPRACSSPPGRRRHRRRRPRSTRPRVPDGALHRRVVHRPADLPRAQHRRPALDRPQQRRAVLRSTVGTRGVRDPALVRSPAGDRYWIIATDLCIACGRTGASRINDGSRNLVVWESTDLVTWSAPWLLNVAGAIPDGRNAWAPEAIWNPATGDYVLYWATNVAPQRRDQAPHLLRPHQRLPQHHHPADLHRPARQPGDHRHADHRGAGRRRRLPLRPGLPATARSPSRAATRSSAPGPTSATSPASASPAPRSRARCG